MNLDDKVDLIYVTHSNHVPVCVTVEQAGHLMDEWRAWMFNEDSKKAIMISKHSTPAGTHFTINLNAVVGMYIRDRGSTAQDRIAAAIERQVSEGQEWRQ